MDKMATAVTILMVLLIFYPIATLVYGSFADGPPWKSPSFTLRNYVDVFSAPDTLLLLRNTLIYSAGKTLLVLAVAIYLAWLVGRTDTPLRSLVEKLVLVAFFVPAYLMAIIWIFLLSPRIGYLNFALKLFGIEKPLFDVFTFPGMVFVSSAVSLPYAYFIISSAIKNMDPSLEESARMCGANTFKTFIRVTIPLMRPAILSAALISIVIGIQAFDTPLILGSLAKIPVFTTAIYEQVRKASPDYPHATALSMVLVIIVAIMVYLQRKFQSNMARFVTLTGKGYRASIIQLGIWKYPAALSLIFLLTVYALLPVAVLIIEAFSDGFTTLTISTAKLTLRHFVDALNYPRIAHAFFNTILLSVTVGILAVILAVVAAYVVVKSDFKRKSLLESVIMIPLGIPSIVIALGALWAYIRTPIYGTPILLILAYLARKIQFAFRTQAGSLAQIHNELEEAARISGASWLRSFLRVVIPIIKPAMVAGFILAFIASFNELAMALLLTTPGNELLGPLILEIWGTGNTGIVAALGLINFGVIIAATLIAKKLLRIEFSL